MKKRILQINTAKRKTVGNSVIYSPLPGQGISQISPFLMLDHLPPTVMAPGQPFYVPPHPHRGFEPVTLLFSGGVEHKDSVGNHGLLSDGAVQWTTAGSGILHSEGSHPDLIPTGTTMHLIQLWVNLPKAHKMTTPRYQDIPSEEIPVIKFENNAKLRVISGNYQGTKGAAKTFSPILLLHGLLPANSTIQIVIPKTFNSALYTTLGKLKVQDQELVERQMAIFDNDGNELVEVIGGDTDSEFIVMAGEPINEPVASYGPFVMNSQAEILEAIRDYQSGKMGVLQD